MTPPATAAAGSFPELFQRLLLPAAPAAVRALRRRPEDTPPELLIEAVRPWAPLRVERCGTVADLTTRTTRGLCLLGGNGGLLVEALADGAWRIDPGGSRMPRRVPASVLAPLFPCTVVYLTPVAAAGAGTVSGRALGTGVGVTAVYLRLTSQLLGLATPIAMMLIIDKVVSSGSWNTLVVLVSGVALLTLVQYLFTAAATLQATREAELGALALRQGVFGALVRSPAAPAWAGAGWEVLQTTTESLRHRVEAVPQWWADCLYVSLLGVLMAAFSPLLLAVSAAFVPGYVAIGAWSAARSRRQAAPLGERRNELSGQYFEAVTAVTDVRGLDLAGYLTSRWHDLDAGGAAARWRLTAEQKLSGQAVELLQKASLLIVMLLGVSAVLEGALTLGQYIAFNLLSMQLAPAVLRLAAFRRNAVEQRLRDESLGRLLAGCAERRWPVSGAQPFPAHGPLVMRAVGIGFVGAMVRVDLTLRTGAWLGIVGPSGCGKSTLLRCLAGLAAPAQGEITVNDVPLEHFAADGLARHVRLVPQQPPLFAGSIADNIRLGDPAAAPELIVTAATVCGLGALLETLPRHLDTPIGAGARAVSDGERQRIVLARAIVARPRLLLLDEATAALDAPAEALLFAHLRRFLPDAAVVVVSHRPASLAGCEEVLDLSCAARP